MTDAVVRSHHRDMKNTRGIALSLVLMAFVAGSAYAVASLTSKTASNPWQAAGAMVEGSSCPVPAPPPHTWNFGGGTGHVFAPSPGIQSLSLAISAGFFGPRLTCEVQIDPHADGSWAQDGATGTCDFFALSPIGNSHHGFVVHNFVVIPTVNTWSIRGDLIGLNDGAGCARVVTAELR